MLDTALLPRLLLKTLRLVLLWCSVLWLAATAVMVPLAISMKYWNAILNITVISAIAVAAIVLLNRPKS